MRVTLLAGGIFIFIFTFFSNSVFSQVNPPASCTAAIGSPANGASHYIDINWSAVNGATSYELQYSTDGSNWNALYSGANPFTSHNTGSGGNLPYYYRVRAIQNSNQSVWKQATQYPIYSACNNPMLPQLSNPVANGLTVSLVPETAPDTNTSYTTYAIVCANNNLYVQANGSLAATAVYQTISAWGSIAVTGLQPSTNYCFYAIAKNNDGDTRYSVLGPFNVFETWDFNSLDTTSASPTNVWWSPGSNPGGVMQYSSVNGCPPGSVGFSGSQNNFWTSYLRSPAVNCNGLNWANLSFNVTNSYFASHTADKLKFYIKAPTIANPGGAFIPADSVNGNISDSLAFNVSRSCASVNVVFDLSTVTDRSAILFYIQASCGYNDANTYTVWLDNTTISSNGGPDEQCSATAPCASASILNSPVDTTVCNGSGVVFSVTASGYIASYVWQVSTNSGTSWNNLSNGGNVSGANTATVHLSNVTSGMNGNMYRVVVTDTCGFSPISANATLSVSVPITTIGQISGTNSVCKGDTGVTYSVPASVNVDSFVWQIPAGAHIRGIATSNAITVDFDTSFAGGNFQVTPVNLCGSGTASPVYTVSVKTPPAQPLAITGSSYPCKNTAQSYSVPLVSGALSYTWTVPVGWTGSSTTNSIQITTGNSSDTIYVSANNGCGSSSAQLLAVTIVSSPPTAPAAITGPDSICSGLGAVYIASFVNGSDSYTWTLPNNWSGNSATDTISVVAGTTTGLVSVTANNGCGSSAQRSKSVVIKPSPQVIFNYTAAPLCNDNTPLTLNTATPYGGIYSGPGVNNNTFTPGLVGPGTYTINYVYINVYGCTGSDTSQIRVKDCNGIYDIDASNEILVYPNPFTNSVIVEFNENTGGDLIVYDNVGKEVLRANIPSSSKYIQANTNGLPAGLYILTIRTDKGNTLSRRLVKMD